MATLREQGYDWIAITSPEAAAVFVGAWRQAGEPPVRVAVVGKGSGKVLEALVPGGQLNPLFTPSKVGATKASEAEHARACLLLGSGGPQPLGLAARCISHPCVCILCRVCASVSGAGVPSTLLQSSDPTVFMPSKQLSMPGDMSGAIALCRIAQSIGVSPELPTFESILQAGPKP